VYEETLTGRPHDTSVQKATSDNENVDADFIVKYKCNITCQSNIVFNYFSITNRFYNMSRMFNLNYSGTNGLNSADVPLSNKQTCQSNMIRNPHKNNTGTI